MKPLLNLQDLYYSLDPDGFAPMDADNGKVQNKIQSVGGWRGLFDPCSHEWKQSTIEEKLEAIRETEKAFECQLDTLIWWYFRDNTGKDRRYLLDAIPMAIHEYAKVDREAEQFLMLCKHPVFLWFSDRFIKGRERVSYNHKKFTEANPDLLLVFRS